MQPNGEDAKFDIDYYIKTHMKLAMDTWGPMGMVSYQVTKNLATASGEAPPFVVQAALQFKSVDHFKEASAQPGSKTVLADVPNFTNIKPILVVGEEVDSK